MQSDSTDIFGNTSFGGVQFSSGGGGVAVAVILASGLAMVVRRRSILAGLSIASAVVTGVSVLLFPSDLIRVLAGGVLLGCAAVQANSRRILQALLTGSFLLGLLGAGAVEALQYPGIPRGYADYLTESDLGTPLFVPVLCALVVLTAAWAAPVDLSRQGPPSDRRIRTVGAILLIAVGGLLIDMVFAYDLFGNVDSVTGSWYFGILVLPVLFAAAGLLPGRGGVMVLAGTAVLLTSTTTSGVGIDVSDGVWVLVVVAVTAVAVAAGTASGLRWGHPLIGIALLALVCVTALFDSPPLDNVNYVASLVAFPAAAAYLYVSCSRTGPTASALGLAVPLAITVPMVVTYGWTAYTPLTSAITSTSWSDLWLSAGAAFAPVVLCGVGIWALNHYWPSEETT